MYVPNVFMFLIFAAWMDINITFYTAILIMTEKVLSCINNPLLKGKKTVLILSDVALEIYLQFVGLVRGLSIGLTSI